MNVRVWHGDRLALPARMDGSARARGELRGTHVHLRLNQRDYVAAQLAICNRLCLCLTVAAYFFLINFLLEYFYPFTFCLLQQID